jgi:gliding motility-associated-like protein
MKTFTLIRYLLVLFICLSSTYLLAQRNYANTQQTGTTGILCVNCIVTSPGNAVDNSPQTFSTLNVVLGVAAQTYQDLIFPAPGVTAGTAVHIKLGTGNSLLSAQVLGAVFIRPYNGTTPAGPAVAASSLVTAASNNNQVEVILTPTQAYDRVRVTLDGGIAGALDNFYVYDAYYNGNGPIACNTAIDELHGISSALLGLGLNLGGVANPELAIDGDITTASTLNAGVGAVGAFAQQTVIYQSPSVVGDSIRLTLSIPQALIDAGVLSSISVSTANGNVDNNDTRNLSSALLRVSLLNILTNGQRSIRVTFVPVNVFDRVQLRLGGGIANVLSTLNFYEAQRLIPGPVVTYNGGAANNIQICQGSTATLNTIALANTVFNWYTTPTGGAPVFTGATFTTPPLTANTTYYVEAMRNGCTDASVRTAVAITVGACTGPDVTVTPPVQGVKSGQTATMTASSTTPNATYNWYARPTGGAPIFTGASFTTPPVTGTVTYYAEATDPATGLVSSPRASGTVLVSTGPDVAVTPPSQGVPNGQTATMTASSTTPNATYNWYTTPTGGATIFTGAVFTTPPVTGPATYYAEATDPVTGAVSSPRAAGMVMVNTGPNVTVTPPNQGVKSGQTATMTASSNTPNATYRWYTTPTGGAPIFTGATFTTPPVTGSVTYYAEAIDPATGAVSSPRASGSVTVSSGPDVAVTPPSQGVKSGQTATMTASSTTPNATYKWYATSIGGNPIFTGAVFTTPPVTGLVTYYAEATDPTTGAVSSPRASGSVTVSSGPDVAVTPPSQGVKSGQTATMTASSTTPNATYKWYATPTGGDPIFSGAIFTTPPVTGPVTYYAEATDPTTGAVSSPRASGSVTVSSGPDVAVTPPSQGVKSGQTATMTASSTTPNTTFKWYTTPTGGNPVFTGAVFTTPPVTGPVTYYAEATDPATGTVSSPRAAGSVTVSTGPDVAVTPPSQGVKSGQTATMTASSTTPNATYKWYATPTGGDPLFTGAAFTTPPVTGPVTYYAEATDPATGAVSSPRAAGMVTVSSGPDVAVTPPSQGIKSGQTATMTASSTTPNATYKWYATPTGGNPIFTGAVFTTPPVTGPATYYAEATDPATGTISSPRASGSVTVISGPDVAVTPPSQGLKSGQTAIITASSTIPNTTFKWYTTPTGGNPIFTGPVFTTPPVTGPATYYAEATNPATGAVSSPRAAATVTVSSGPDVAVTPPNQGVKSGQTATITASSTTKNTTFKWYTTPTGGSPIFTGAVFTTPPVTGTATYYAEATDPATGTVSSPRASGTVMVSTGPDVSVTPTSQGVKSGQTATLTASSITPNVTYKWYTTTTGGSPIFTGAVFTTPPVNGPATYYAEAIEPATGAVSSPRTSGSVAVSSGPDITVTPATQGVQSGQTATMTASSTTPGVVFNWYTTPTGGTPIYTGPVFTTPRITTSTSYYAESTNPATDVASFPRFAASIVITSSNIFIPNAFSPNADGRNDTFNIYGSSIIRTSMWVYNQWGQLLFRSDDFANGWNGTYKGVIQPVGVYVYYAKVTLNDNSVISKKGTITLIR